MVAVHLYYGYQWISQLNTQYYIYYRRRLVLGMLEYFGGELDDASLQKTLFLVTRRQSVKSYDFVPYICGCYSFLAHQDLLTMTKYQLVEMKEQDKDSNWALIKNSEDYFENLRRDDQVAIKKVRQEIKNFTRRELMKHVHLNFPYYAIKSKIASDLLSPIELANVERQKRFHQEFKIFTIGYQGTIIETYLNKLILNDVKIICDLRKLPLSKKFGFSKNQLKNAANGVGIKYVHFPELGIDSDKRKHLKTSSDYEALLDEYENTTLKTNFDTVERLIDLIKRHRRIAITGFEKEAEQCHRSRVLNALITLPKWEIQHRHL